MILAERVASRFLQARGLVKTKSNLSLGLTIQQAKPSSIEQPGIPRGSVAWDVKGSLDIFPLMGNPVRVEMVLYSAPGFPRLYFTNLKSSESGRCSHIVVRALDTLLENVGTDQVLRQLK